MASVGIQVTAPPTVVAPAQVWLEAVDQAGFTFETSGVVYDPAFHEITYLWTVRGEPLPAFGVPQNMVDGWNNPNLARGKLVALCFSEPGDYIVDLLAVDRFGNTATAATETITVQDPDAAFPGASTIAIAQDGDVTFAPEGATFVSSFAQAYDVLNTRSAPTRVLFKRGEDYDNVRFFGGAGLAYIGAWGSGAKPVLRPDYSFRDDPVIQYWSGADQTHVQIVDLDIRCEWDASKENGWNGNYVAFSLNQAVVPNCFWTIHGCAFSGWGISVWAAVTGGTVARNRLMVSDTTITDWQNYGILCQNMNDGYTAVIGSRITQNVNALEGGSKDYPHNDHGPIRLSLCQNYYVAQNDLFSRNGWSGHPDTQPCLRIDAKGVLDVGCNVWRNVMESGYEVIKMEGENDTTPDNPGNYVIDANLLLGTSQTHAQIIKCHKGGSTFRNNVAIVPNAPVINLTAGRADRSFVQFHSQNPANGNSNEPVAAYNNTLINLRDTTNDNDIDWVMIDDLGTFTDVTDDNNILHFPDSDAPVAPFAPINVSPATEAIPGVTPRYAGKLNGFKTSVTSVGTTTPNGAVLSFPYADVTRERTDDEDAGTTTDQAYWQAVPAGDNRHILYAPGGLIYHAYKGDFTVSYADPTHILITNTSGVEWPAGTVKFKPDRSSLLGPLDVTYAMPPALPLPRPQAGSLALNGGDAGFGAYEDFFGTVRPQSGKTAGAIQTG